MSARSWAARPMAQRRWRAVTDCVSRPKQIWPVNATKVNSSRGRRPSCSADYGMTIRAFKRFSGNGARRMINRPKQRFAALRTANLTERFIRDY